MITRSKQSGYTLVEAVLYVALFVGLSVVLIDVLLLMSKAYTETRVNRELLDASQSLVERMTREVRGATSVDVSGSTFDTSTGVLRLNTQDASGTAKTVVFRLVSGRVEVLENSMSSGYLSGEQVTVNSLYFRNINSGKAVRFELSLASLRTPSHPAVVISDTAVLRGSY